MITLASEIQTKHNSTLCGQKVKCVDVKLVVHKVTTELYRNKHIFVRTT